MDRDNQTSQLKLFSLGIVANNKALSSNIIKVTPIESLTMLDGELISEPTDVEAAGVDASGTSYSTKITTDNAIEAEWLPTDTNRRTAPDVRRGERVLIYQVADTDQYRWQSLNMDLKLRKLETVIYSFSGTADEEADSTDPDNCYSLEISTHTGQITLRTSKANEEHCVYAFQLNTKEGRALLTDDLGNEFEIDSKNTIIQLLNADKSLVKLNKLQIEMFAKDSITAIAKNSILFKTNNFKIDCSTYRLECATGSVKGTMTFENQVTFNQAVTTQGLVTANGGLNSPSVPIHGPTETLD